MRFTDYYENMTDLNIMHCGENTPHAYFIPFDRGQIPGDRLNSARCTWLDGDWSFRYYDSITELPDDFSPQAETLDDTVPVPSTWQFTGYDHFQYTNVRYPFPYDPPYVPAENPCGLYRREFDIAKEPERHYDIVFEGVDSCFFLWVNNTFIGYSQVSHSPAEFDITSVLRDGKNTVYVLVLKWCAGSYFEDQDKFRYSGIFRDVYILKRDEKRIMDFVITTPCTPDFLSADVRVQCTFSHPGMTAEVVLKDAEGFVIADGTAGNEAFVCTVTKPSLWTAETPYLYTLTLRCGEERIDVPLGIRQLEIRNQIVYLNGSKVRLRGVNLHESSCETGAYTPKVHIVRDLLLMKKHNINAVRTSHYPQPPYFYELCNKLGIYVLDEADLETHGVTHCHPDRYSNDYNLIADDPYFATAILDRVQRLVLRDRNLPCVLIWSMGNESGHGINIDEALRWTKQTDGTRLTHYERASFPPEGREINRMDLDLYSRMYPSTESIKQYFAENAIGKPYILCEYCHAMGNGPGDTEDYFAVFDAEDRIVGAFVWEWCNHAPYIGTNDKGQKCYRYGGDFGEVMHDGNFCADGLVTSDRQPTPGLLAYKNTLRPARVTNWDEQTGTVTLKNYLDYTDLGRFACLECTISGGNEPDETVTIDDFSIPPRGTAQIQLPLRKGGSCIIRILQKEDTAWAQYGHELGIEQIGRPACDLKWPEMHGSMLKTDRINNRYLKICGDSFEYTFDLMTGLFRDMYSEGKKVLTAPMAWNLWRAPTDNDRNIRRQWDGMFMRCATGRARNTAISSQDTGLRITSDINLTSMSAGSLVSGSIIWQIMPDGRVQMDTDLEKHPHMHTIPRVGIRMKFRKKMDRILFYGMGPGESYIDKNSGSVYGQFDEAVSDQYSHPLKPQESGSHYDCEAVSLYGRENAFSVTGNGFSFSALPYTQEQLTDTMHDDELDEYPGTILCIDLFQRGIGSNSCGPELDEKYELTAPIRKQLVMAPVKLVR